MKRKILAIMGNVANGKMANRKMYVNGLPVICHPEVRAGWVVRKWE